MTEATPSANLYEAMRAHCRNTDPAVVALVRAARALEAACSLYLEKESDPFAAVTLADETALNDAIIDCAAALAPFQHIKDAE